MASVKEWGERNADGSVSVYSQDETGKITLVRKESYTQNQGGTPPAATADTPVGNTVKMQSDGLYHVYVNGQDHGGFPDQASANQALLDISNGKPHEGAKGGTGAATVGGTKTYEQAHQEWLSGGGSEADWQAQHPSGSGGKTLAQMRSELQVAGYNGPWDDASVQAAYTRTVNGGTTGSGGDGGFQLPPGYLNSNVEWAKIQEQQAEALLAATENALRLQLIDMPLTQVQKDRIVLDALTKTADNFLQQNGQALQAAYQSGQLQLGNNQMRVGAANDLANVGLRQNDQALSAGQTLANTGIQQNAQALSAGQTLAQTGLQQNAQALQAATEAGTLGLGVGNLIGSLRGPRNAFQQQAAMNGLDSMGLSNAIDAINGNLRLPSFGAPAGAPEPATLATMSADLKGAGGIPQGPTLFDYLTGFAAGKTPYGVPTSTLEGIAGGQMPYDVPTSSLTGFANGKVPNTVYGTTFLHDAASGQFPNPVNPSLAGMAQGQFPNQVPVVTPPTFSNTPMPDLSSAPRLPNGLLDPSKLPKFAGGGTATGPSVVGERGPEEISPGLTASGQPVTTVTPIPGPGFGGQFDAMWGAASQPQPPVNPTPGVIAPFPTYGTPLPPGSNPGNWPPGNDGTVHGGPVFGTPPPGFPTTPAETASPGGTTPITQPPTDTASLPNWLNGVLADPNAAYNQSLDLYGQWKTAHPGQAWSAAGLSDVYGQMGIPSQVAASMWNAAQSNPSIAGNPTAWADAFKAAGTSFGANPVNTNPMASVMTDMALRNPQGGPGTIAPAPPVFAGPGGGRGPVVVPITSPAPTFGAGSGVNQVVPITPTAPVTLSTPAPVAPATPAASTLPDWYQQYIDSLPLPNQIPFRQWQNFSPDTQNFIISAMEAKGWSANDVLNQIARSAPQFHAPAFATVM